MPSSLQDSTSTLYAARDVLDLALSLNKARNTDEILLELIQSIIDVCQAERATIFTLSRTTHELVSKVKNNHQVQDIRVPLAKSSIAGYAAETGKIDQYQ